MSITELDIQDHYDAVELRSRFGSVEYRGRSWDLSHLSPFAFSTDLGADGEPLRVDVVVFFSCHCFTHGDDESGTLVADYYRDGFEVRVLCEERYALSKRFLPRLVKELNTRHIRVASSQPNFLTVEVLQPGGPSGLYAVFFTVQKDKRRAKRMLLRVQSAYRIEGLTQRQRNAGKVRLATLLRAAYAGRKIKG
jgi:hypothetical protein